MGPLENSLPGVDFVPWPEKLKSDFVRFVSLAVDGARTFLGDVSVIDNASSSEPPSTKIAKSFWAESVRVT